MIKTIELGLEDIELQQHQYIRNYEAVEIRKTSREMMFQKKRVIQDQQGEEHQPAQSNEQLLQAIIFFKSQHFCLEQVPLLTSFLSSGNLKDNYMGIIGILKLLNTEEEFMQNISKNEFIVVSMLNLLQLHEKPDIIDYTTSCLVNCVAGRQLCFTWDAVRQIIDECLNLVNTMEEQTPNVFNNIVLVLLNITLDKSQYRNYMLSNEACNILSNRFASIQKTDMLMENYYDLICIFCKDELNVPFEQVQLGLISIMVFLSKYDHTELTISRSLVAVQKYIKKANGNLGYFFSTDILEFLLNKLTNPSEKIPERIYELTLAFIGSITFGDEQQMEMMLELGGYQFTQRQLSHQAMSVRVEALWVLSNFVCDRIFFEKVIEDEEIMGLLTCNLFNPDSDQIVRQTCMIMMNFIPSFSDKARFIKLAEEMWLLGGFQALLASKKKNIQMDGIYIIGKTIGLLENKKDKDDQYQKQFIQMFKSGNCFNCLLEILEQQEQPEYLYKAAYGLGVSYFEINKLGYTDQQ